VVNRIRWSRRHAQGVPADPTLVVRPVTHADDLATIGRIVLESYTALPGHPPEPAYERELADVAARIEAGIVLGAFSGDRPLGCVTFVRDADSSLAEDLQPGESGFRMLAVGADARGRGIGEALVRRCLDEAGLAGSRAVFIHSGTWMTAAHRLYVRLGFERVPDRDWAIADPPISLLAFRRAV
jgi:ribosomal protein S18 acetylase RimI-like enzyme